MNAKTLERLAWKLPLKEILRAAPGAGRRDSARESFLYPVAFARRTVSSGSFWGRICRRRGSAARTRSRSIPKRDRAARRPTTTNASSSVTSPPIRCGSPFATRRSRTDSPPAVSEPIRDDAGEVIGTFAVYLGEAREPSDSRAYGSGECIRINRHGHPERPAGGIAPRKRAAVRRVCSKRPRWAISRSTRKDASSTSTRRGSKRLGTGVKR